MPDDEPAPDDEPGGNGLTRHHRAEWAGLCARLEDACNRYRGAFKEGAARTGKVAASRIPVVPDCREIAAAEISATVEAMREFMIRHSLSEAPATASETAGD